MSKDLNITDATFKEAVNIAKANNKMSLTEVARACGRTQPVLSGMLINGRPSLASMIEVFSAMGEDVVLRLSNGQLLKLKIEEKPTK